MVYPLQNMIKRVGYSLGVSSLCLIILPAPGMAQTLRAGIPVEASEPYVIQTETGLQGIVVDLWQEIVTEQNWDYEWVPQTSYGEGVEAVVRGDLDIFVGPISVTSERVEIVAFTQPFDDTQITLLVPSAAPTLWSRIRPFLGLAALSSLGILVGSLFVVGNLIWLVEHKQNPDHFPPQYLHGIGNGMWFALVTLTTVGYGDRAPATPLGRWIAGCWMLITLLAVSSITAGLASALTVSLSDRADPRFQGVDDLRNARIAALQGSSSLRWAEYYNANVTVVESFDQGVDQVLANQVEGFIAHGSVLTHYLNQNPDLELAIADFPVATEMYAFALPRTSELIQSLNLTLVRLREEGIIQSTKDEWLN